MTADGHTQSAAWTMDGLTESIAVARDHARDFLRDDMRNAQSVSAEAVEAVLLAVSELATNAVRYAPGPFVLAIDVDDDCVRVAVTDASPVRPAARPARFDGSGGLGLHMLEALAGQVETAAHDRGKTVSVRIAR